MSTSLYRKIKLVVCDVDGTLINQSETITESLNTLRDYIAAKEIPFTLASGRCMSMLKDFIELLNIRMPVIANNGATAIIGDGALWDDYIDPMKLKPAILSANDMDMVIIMGDGRSEVAYRHNAYIQNQIEKFGRYNHFHIPLDSEWPNLKLQKTLIIDPEKPGKIDKVIELLKPNESELNIVRYNDRSVDIMPKMASKGQALDRLTKHLGINMSEVMTIGNDKNDIEMIRAAGIGVAVGNASDDLKKEADYVCEAENALGVLEALNHFL